MVTLVKDLQTRIHIDLPDDSDDFFDQQRARLLAYPYLALIKNGLGDESRGLVTKKHGSRRVGPRGDAHK